MRKHITNLIFISDILIENIYKARLYWSIFDLHFLIYIYILLYILFILICYDCTGHLLYILNDILFELLFGISKKRSWHYWQLRNNFVQASIIRLYGAFCKHHGHRTASCTEALWKEINFFVSTNCFFKLMVS